MVTASFFHFMQLVHIYVLSFGFDDEDGDN